MKPQPSRPSRLIGTSLFAVVLALAVVVLPLLFGPRITVSPLLLFGAAVIPNFTVYLIPDTADKGGRFLYSRVFYLRVIVSVVAAFLLLAIYRIAFALGQA